MVLLSCSGTSGGIYAKLANEATRHNCARASRRLAYEASDCGLLSPDLAAGIRRVRGVRRLGVRVGNWLTAGEGKKLLGAETADTLRSRRNRALLSLLIGCGLRRAEDRGP
jgi:integrase